MRTDGQTWLSFYPLLAILQSHLKTNAAIWVNKMCRLSYLTPKYMNITINDDNQQSINTKRMATTYRINQELNFLYLKKQKLKEQLYQMHLTCAHQLSSTWNNIQDAINNQQRIMAEKLYTKLNSRSLKVKTQLYYITHTQTHTHTHKHTHIYIYISDDGNS
jgi:hypothetical protein